MAFNRSNRWEGSFSLKDNNGKFSSLSFYLPGSLTDVQAAAVMAAIRTPLTALTNARITSVYLLLQYRNDDDSPIPAESEVERKLAITFTDASEEYKSSVKVPSPVFTIEQVGTNVVDPAQPLVQAFIDAVINTGLGEGNSPITFAGTDISKIYGDVRVVHSKRDI